MAAEHAHMSLLFTFKKAFCIVFRFRIVAVIVAAAVM